MNKLIASLCCKLALAAAVVPTLAHAAPEEVTYLLPAPPNSPAFGPWMIAQQKGYYADENLKVTFVAGKGGVDVAKQIGAGNAVIGGAIGDTPIVVRANGVPVKAVAVLGAGSLTMVAAHQGENIKSLKDLKGKTMTVMSYTDTTYYALLGNLKSVGLSKSDVQIQAAGPAGVWQLFAGGKAQGMAGVPDWVVSSSDAGAKVELLESNGFKSMAQAILASDETIQKNPQLIKRLVRATLRGMEDIMKDPKAAAATYAEAVPAYKGKEASIEQVFELYRKYVYANQKPLGVIDPKRMEEVQKFYVSEAIVPKATPVNDLYTNQFVGTER
ncbi:NitT/TauT family transport system substrate-binding protein [Noviherbaspirillum humi]|uniref:NitT/TauT family transport system substrate-binding protein n=1 Tax=Noviherbaspirillum humi TaxID=1688639 RepID=A0A239I6R0_9BURK|nr:ABC transporter substrate-binding protein [Noviherbaspirillum humi]SNS89072.1 NitT/TauT family transport system substrate-binding protein [Noviherbaspirillum humi]